MKEKIKYLILSLFLLSAYGCSLFDNEENPDPRDTFVGSYKMEAYDVNITDGVDDTTYRAASHPDIEFEMDDALTAGELKVDLEEFIEETLEEVFSSITTGVKVSIEFENEDDLIAVISGDTYQINELDFILTLEQGTVVSTFNSEFAAEGTLEANALTMEFEMATFSYSQINYSGTATGEKK